MARFDSIPNNVQFDILFILSIKDLIRLSRTSHYWKRRISNDGFLWRRIYIREFGHDFVKDRWILWAVRRLWSQSSLEEKQLAARHVNLITLEHLDEHTWYRLVRGRILTKMNWRNNTPQRSVVFTNESHDIWQHSFAYKNAKTAYDIIFSPEGNEELTFIIIDNILNDTRSIDTLSSGVIRNYISHIHRCNSVFKGNVLMSKGIKNAYINHDVSNEEYIIANTVIDYGNPKSKLWTQFILVWDIGHLKVHCIDGQYYSTPSLCMIELLPGDNYLILAQQGGWLLVTRKLSRFEEFKEQRTRYYMLYNIQHRRLVASFFVKGDMQPILGKVMPDKAQIYYSHTMPMTDTISMTVDYQYRWHILEVNAKPYIPPLTEDIA
jgi:hypothetical protein